MSVKQRILKTSFHDEIGLHSVKNEIYQTIFNIGKFENEKKIKIKFSRNLRKNSCKKLDSDFIASEIQHLNKKLILMKKLDHRPEKYSLKIPTNPSLNDLNSQSNNLIKQNNAYKNLLNLLEEREQKNREISTEKIFIKNKLKAITKRKKVNKDFVFHSKNYISL